MAEVDTHVMRILVAMESEREETVTLGLKERTSSTFQLLYARSLESMRSIVRSETLDLIITGVDAFGREGVSILNDLRRITVGVPIVMVSEQPSVGHATEAIRQGAADFIHVTPEQISDLPATLERIRDRWKHDPFSWDDITRMHWSFELREAVHRAETVDEALGVVLRKVCETTGWRYGEVWWPDENESRLRWREGHSHGGYDAASLKSEVSEFVINQDQGLIVDAWSTRRPAWERDVRNSTTFARRETAMALGVRSAVAIPVLNRGSPYAVIAFFNDDVGSRDHLRIDLIAAAAMHLGEWLDRKKSEKELTQAGYLLERTFESLNEAVFVIEESTRTIASCNRAAVSMFGYSVEELVGENTTKLHESREAYEEFGRAYPAAIEQKGFFSAEFRMRRKDGTIFPTEHTVTRAHDHEGNAFAVVSVVRDLSGSKQFQEALNVSRARYKNLFEYSHDGIMLFHGDYCVDANNEAERILARSRHELIGKSVAEVFPEELNASPGAGQSIEAHFRAAQRGEPRAFQCRYTTSDGALLEFDGTVTRNPGDPGIDVQVLLRDRTEERRADRRRYEQFAILEQIAEETTDVVFVKDMEKRYVYVNQAFARLFGRPRAEILGVDDYALWDRETAEAVRADDRSILERGETVTYEESNPIGGKVYRFLTAKGVYRDAEGNPFGVFAIARDVTRQRELQEQAYRTQRMESLGTLASGIAHDMNNILSPVQMAADLLLGTIGSEKHRGWVRRIQTAVERGSQLTRQLLTFGRGSGGEFETVHPAELIKGLKNLTLATFPKNVTIETQMPKDLWEVTGDVTQLHQVFLNLCVNARDAMPDGGTLSIRARNVTLDEKNLPANPEATPGQYTCIEVQDTGSGISPELIDKIVEPFYTMKAAEKGTGLGLSTALGIIKEHQGFLEIDSEVGKGSVFQVYLPAGAEPSEKVSQPEEVSTARGSQEWLLVVDDEEPIREMTEALLKEGGYRCVTAGNGQEALNLLQRHDSEIRLVLTDLFMPAGGGLELIRSLKSESPDLPIVVMSGYLDSQRHEELNALGVSAIIEKPLTRTELVEVVEKALGNA